MFTKICHEGWVTKFLSFLNGNRIDRILINLWQYDIWIYGKRTAKKWLLKCIHIIIILVEKFPFCVWRVQKSEGARQRFLFFTCSRNDIWHLVFCNSSIKQKLKFHFCLNWIPVDKIVFLPSKRIDHIKLKSKSSRI